MAHDASHEVSAIMTRQTARQPWHLKQPWYIFSVGGFMASFCCNYFVSGPPYDPATMALPTAQRPRHVGPSGHEHIALLTVGVDIRAPMASLRAKNLFLIRALKATAEQTQLAILTSLRTSRRTRHRQQSTLGNLVTMQHCLGP